MVVCGSVSDADAGRCLRNANTLCEKSSMRCDYVVRAGEAWRMMPNDLPPWDIVYQQTRRWIKAGVFEAMTHDLRELLRMLAGAIPSRRRRSSTAARCRAPPKAAGVAVTTEPNARKEARRTWRWTRWDICWRCMSHSADQQDRSRVKQLAKDVQQATGNSVSLAFRGSRLHRRSTGRRRGKERHRIVGGETARGQTRLRVCYARWVVERSFGWLARFRRLARDYERLATTLAGLHFVAFAC